MRLSALLLSLTLVVASGVADARGGSSSGGGRGGFSGGGARSAPSAPARPAAAPAPARPAAAPAPAKTTTTTSTTTTRTATAGGGYVGGPVMYGGMGMGYGYSNGLLTGLIIGNMMHPHNTVVYSGPGPVSNNALLYPDGRVVSQSGQLVGTYQNGQYTAIPNGPMVAQAAPADAVQAAPAQPVVIKQESSAAEVLGIIALVFVCIFLFILLMAILV